MFLLTAPDALERWRPVALVAPLGGAFVRKNVRFDPSHHLNSLIRKVASTATGGASPIGKVAPHSHGWRWWRLYFYVNKRRCSYARTWMEIVVVDDT